MTIQSLSLSCLAACALSAAAAASASPQFHEVNLETAVGPSLFARAINDAGIAVFSGFENGQRVSKLYDVSTGQVVRVLPGDLVTAINNRGDLVGLGSTGAWYETDGVRTPLPLQRPLAVNDRGEVVGFAGGFFPLGVLYSVADGTLTTLSLGGNQSVAYAINASGRVAGYGTLPGTWTVHAFLWDRGALRDLGTLGGDQDSFAYAINGRKDVAGTASTASGVAHAFLFDGETMLDLGALPGCERSKITALNDPGAAVGNSDLCSSGPLNGRAFLFTRKGGLVDLNSLVTATDGYTFSVPVAINNAGTIVGTAVGPDGFAERPFLLVREDN